MPDPFAPGLLSRLRHPPRKVALLRASRIGAFICATPAFRALRVALPEAEITMITLPMLRDLVERSLHLDHFAPFPGYPGIAEQLFEPRRTVAFLQQMQAERFDLAIPMQGSGVNSNPFTLLRGAHTPPASYAPATRPAGSTPPCPCLHAPPKRLASSRSPPSSAQSRAAKVPSSRSGRGTTPPRLRSWRAPCPRCLACMRAPATECAAGRRDVSLP